MDDRTGDPGVTPPRFEGALTDRLARFIVDIGLGVQSAELTVSRTPGVTAWRGAVLIDEARLIYPGDLLHEAGHLAVCDPALRPTLEEMIDDPAEEMAASAWSYAAAIAIGIDPALVLHAAFKGGGPNLLGAYETGWGPGSPMLHYWGMSLMPRSAAAQGLRPFPHMVRWLR